MDAPPGYRLHFTGSCDHATFDRACAEQDYWYHSFYFDNGFHVRGDYDIGRDIEGYGFPEDMSGMKVLDVGAGSGWFSFWFDQHGAIVTAVDVRGYSEWDTFGRPDLPPIAVEKPTPDLIEDDEPIYFSSVSRGLWIIRDLLGSTVRFRNARIYDLPTVFQGERFDFIFVGALLLHLRDPIGALAAVRQVCSGRVIATSPILGDAWDTDIPQMILPWTDSNAISWWQPNPACYRKWFEAAGFGDVDVSRTVMLHTDLPTPDAVTQLLTIGEARA